MGFVSVLEPQMALSCSFAYLNGDKKLEVFRILDLTRTEVICGTQHAPRTKKSGKYACGRWTKKRGSGEFQFVIPDSNFGLSLSHQVHRNLEKTTKNEPSVGCGFRRIQWWRRFYSSEFLLFFFQNSKHQFIQTKYQGRGIGTIIIITTIPLIGLAVFKTHGWCDFH